MSKGEPPLPIWVAGSSHIRNCDFPYVAKGRKVLALCSTMRKVSSYDEDEVKLEGRANDDASVRRGAAALIYTRLENDVSQPSKPMKSITCKGPDQ